MADMNKIASILGFEDNDDGTAVEQAQEAITEAAKKTGSVKKLADLLGIDEEVVMTLIAYKIAGKTAEMNALAQSLRIIESMRQTPLMASRARG